LVPGLLTQLQLLVNCGLRYPSEYWIELPELHPESPECDWIAIRPVAGDLTLTADLISSNISVVDVHKGEKRFSFNRPTGQSKGIDCNGAPLLV
jgi:hypothetical protein